ncbi:NADPH:quinone reductase [Thalassobius sp. Cn5-15]|uniref:NADPH:quinone reductase n=1 Tax=Thalassobius sp. Cn5-15 TaxID=2917763 RepID=UPI001EF33410|nr:NADPH:quinone reductase [Thalassobius sp. Cn5-15]MCG7494124.1 NADPH:quinone reductase [Thalassobius sp. Cn5-15]
MRAITYSEFGPAAEVLKLVDLPTPHPAYGEVLVRLKASGVNPSDISGRSGMRPGVTTPAYPQIIPHSDGAGVIEAVGEGVDPARIGQRVWIWNGQWQRAFGTAADYIALPSLQAVALPDNITFSEGAVLGIPAMTATYCVLGGGDVAGKTLLVSGGGGTVGRLAVQIAKTSGARVISTAGNAAQQEAARQAGADAVLGYNDPDLAAGILAANDGQPVDQIVEVEFGRNAEVSTAVIAERGRIVAYGSAKDRTPMLPFYPLMFKGVTLEMALVYILSESARRTTEAQLTTLLEQGALDIRIAHTLPLEACAEAHDRIANGQRAGSVILTI